MRPRDYVALCFVVCQSALALCHTTQPLNERATTWTKWLLPEPPEGPPRRRITPKCIFCSEAIKPTEMPPCAEGYRSDAMGRCSKITQIDEDSQDSFFENMLNMLHPVSPEGPLKVHIEENDLVATIVDSQETSTWDLLRMRETTTYTTLDTTTVDSGDTTTTEAPTTTDVGTTTEVEQALFFLVPP